MNTDSKRTYSIALLNCSTNHKQMLLSPVAFGELAVKERIKNVLSYKKPAFWVVVLTCVLCVGVSLCFMTGRAEFVSKDSIITIIDEKLDAAVSMAIMEINDPSDYAKGVFEGEEHIIYGTEKDGDNTIVYCCASYSVYDMVGDKAFECSGSMSATVFTFKQNEKGEYEMLSYSQPDNGSMYEDSVKSLFPSKYAKRVFNFTEQDKKLNYDQHIENVNAYKYKTPLAYIEAYLEKSELTTVAVLMNEESSVPYNMSVNFEGMGDSEMLEELSRISR